MARIVYALTDQGRGHGSRVTAIAEQLEARGHELLFVCGGVAHQIMVDAGRRAIEVPVLRSTMHNNRIRLWFSLASMGVQQIQTAGTVGRLAQQLAEFRPDLLVSDFETFSVRAARRLKVPVLAFNHQQVLTKTKFEVPPEYAWDAWVAKLVINTASPRDAAHVLVSSFFFPELIDPKGTTLIGPIYRRAVLDLQPEDGDEVLVYHNDPAGYDAFIEELAAVDARFVLYNFRKPEDPSRYPNLRFEEPSVAGFLADLRRARAVIASAGYTLMCEAMLLKKPQLAIPNQGIFEQTLNAIYLEKMGLGEAVHARMATTAQISAFLSRLDQYRARLSSHPVSCGNDDAVACIERWAQVGAAGRG